MNIKNVIFIATIISCNMSDSIQAYQESAKQTPNAQQILIDTCKKRLEDLEKEEKEQYSHTNYCWYGAVTGAGLIVLGCIMKEDKDAVLLKAGFATLLTSSGIGVVSMTNENHKAASRRQERAFLYDRLNQSSQNR